MRLVQLSQQGIGGAARDKSFGALRKNQRCLVGDIGSILEVSGIGEERDKIQIG
jgi:hypothetical protein